MPHFAYENFAGFPLPQRGRGRSVTALPLERQLNC